MLIRRKKLLIITSAGFFDLTDIFTVNQSPPKRVFQELPLPQKPGSLLLYHSSLSSLFLCISLSSFNTQYQAIMPPVMMPANSKVNVHEKIVDRIYLAIFLKRHLPTPVQQLTNQPFPSIPTRTKPNFYHAVPSTCAALFRDLVAKNVLFIRFCRFHFLCVTKFIKTVNKASFQLCDYGFGLAIRFILIAEIIFMSSPSFPRSAPPTALRTETKTSAPAFTITPSSTAT